MTEELVSYAEKLFAATHAIEDCFRVAKCLSDLGRYEELSNLLSNNAGLVDQSVNLQSLQAWTLYRDGYFEKARSVLQTLSEYSATASHRALRVDIAISSGDWASLVAYCEEIWADRERASAEELLNAAEISEALNSPHARELVMAATRKSPDNPDILVNAYMQATRGGWEQNPSVATWIQRAGEKSDPKGPVQRVSIKELFDQKPAWDKRASDAIDQLNAGKILPSQLQTC